MDAFSSLQFGAAAAVASAILHSLWQDTLLGIVAALTLAGMARTRAAVRHAVGMAFLLAMVLLPAATVLGLAWGPAVQLNALLPTMTAPHFEAAPRVFLQQSAPFADFLALAWMLGVALMLLRHAGGWWLIGVLDRRRYQALPPAWQERVDRLRAVLRISRRVAVHLSAEVVSPFTARLFRPAIWLPLSLLTQLPASQLEALLAHELAHVARMDWLWNGIQRVLESLLFFHPAAWWLGRRIRQEREHACDDLAVTACGDAIALTEALTALERQRSPSLRLALAATGGSLMQRITRLLSKPAAPARWGARAGAAVLLLAGLSLAVHLVATGRTLPNLRITSTTEGPLGPGDERVITANGLDKQRVYRASVDRQGHLTEVYREDGAVRPIDAPVRRWIDQVSRYSAPPMPSIPQMPSIAPMPPIPSMAADPGLKAVAELAAANPMVLAKLGGPVVLAGGVVSGRLNVGDDAREGDADLRFALRGTRGTGNVHVTADLRGGTWMLTRVELAPSAR